MTTRELKLFYEEPESDRWLPYDRYPRRFIRRLLRGEPQPGGQRRVFLNLCAGLDRIGVRYRVNDYKYARQNSQELACIVGKGIVLQKVKWKNPILFGASIDWHPVDMPDLLTQFPIKKVLVPGVWVREMFRLYWGENVDVWPVGIDTDLWCPSSAGKKNVDVLLYDKVLWEHDSYETSLIGPIRATLRKAGRSFREIRYGFYREMEFHAALRQCRSMIFLCEHESQGIAYQQALSCGVPIMAWDRGGPWKDPAYYPHKIVFEPVTSVPYWSDACGQRFRDASDFDDKWAEFWNAVTNDVLAPRDFILKNLTLEKCARDYLRIVREIESATVS